MGAVFAPLFFPHNLGLPASTLFSAIIACFFYIALGVKDLMLIHREELLEAGAYALLYVAFLLFFMQVLSGMFFFAWLYAAFCAWLSFLLIADDYRIAFLFAVLAGELLWIVSWLPIGFLNSASLCFACALFAGDAVHENRISPKNTAILGALIALILATSRFRI